MEKILKLVSFSKHYGDGPINEMDRASRMHGK
jgi:hypothetical protein